MMEQCFAGGFNQKIVDNSPANRTSVASAAIATQTSIGGPNFDPFARDWISAVHQANPDGSALSSDPDTNNNSRVSAQEAYDYADLVHDPSDTPNYSESSSSAGNCNLGATPIGFIWPYIYVYVERWWKRPWPEAIERLEGIQPELSRLLQAELARRGELEGELEQRVKQALGVEEE